MKRAHGESGTIRCRSFGTVDRKTGGTPRTRGSRGAGAGHARTRSGRGSNQFDDYLITELMRMIPNATGAFEKHINDNDLRNIFRSFAARQGKGHPTCLTRWLAVPELPDATAACVTPSATMSSGNS